MVHGAALISFSMVLGHITGYLTGALFSTGTPVGSLGFAMIYLLLLSSWLKSQPWFPQKAFSGLIYWQEMYIPVVVAMSASQNMVAALSSGVVALSAGAGAFAISLLILYALSKTNLFQEKASPDVREVAEDE